MAVEVLPEVKGTHIAAIVCTVSLASRDYIYLLQSMSLKVYTSSGHAIAL